MDLTLSPESILLIHRRIVDEGLARWRLDGSPRQRRTVRMRLGGALIALGTRMMRQERGAGSAAGTGLTWPAGDVSRCLSPGATGDDRHDPAFGAG